MQLITLTTDFGDTDPYVGIMKGVIYNICSNVQVVDISNNIFPQNIWQANWTLRCSYNYFPPGTIHLCVVDPGVGDLRKPILIQSKKYFFIGPDNGVFTSILEQEIILNIVELTEKKYWLKNISRTFHGREIFSPIAAHLASGVSPKNFGKPIKKEDLVKIASILPVKTKNGCKGIVQHIDIYGNLITNIPDAFLSKEISGKVKNKKFHGLLNSYSEGRSYEPFAIIGSHGFLEVSVNKGNASKLTKAKVGDKVEVEVKYL